MPHFSESSTLRSPRDSDSIPRSHFKHKDAGFNLTSVYQALRQIQSQMNRLRVRQAAPSIIPTQVKPMFPFRIYKPDPLPPDGTAVTTFDSNGAQVAAVVNSTVPTDAGFTNGGTWAATPPPINPTTDAWRFWNVRTGLVEVRPWFSVIQLFSDVGQLQGNYSEYNFVWSGTDGNYPQNLNGLEFDDPTTTANYFEGGTTLIIPGTPASNGIGFSIWVQVVPDQDYYGYVDVRIMGKTCHDLFSELQPFPDSSPLVIPISLILTSIYSDGMHSATDLTVWQLTFDHILNRWPPGMFGAGYWAPDPVSGLNIWHPGSIGGSGALSYRGDWDNDDIQDMVFYPGDVVKVTTAITAFSDSAEVTFSLYGFGGFTTIENVMLFMAQSVCFTGDPSNDGNFVQVSGLYLSS